MTASDKTKDGGSSAVADTHRATETPVVSGHTPWIVEDTGARLWVGPSKAWAHKVADVVCGFDVGSDLTDEANERARTRARLIAAAPDLLDALDELQDVFAHDGENSVERFDRLAEMFDRDTGYMAPGKSRPMHRCDQPDGPELHRIYDEWFAAKIARARAVIAKATTAAETVSVGTDGREASGSEPNPTGDA